MKDNKWLVEYLTEKMVKKCEEITSKTGFDAMRIVTDRNPGSIAISFSKIQ